MTSGRRVGIGFCLFLLFYLFTGYDTPPLGAQFRISGMCNRALPDLRPSIFVYWFPSKHWNVRITVILSTKNLYGSLDPNTNFWYPTACGGWDFHFVIYCNTTAFRRYRTATDGSFTLLLHRGLNPCEVVPSLVLQTSAFTRFRHRGMSHLAFYL